MKETQTPLYKKIFDHYRDKIISGELKPGTRLPSENDMLQSFGVSRITVSRALKELETENYIYRVKGSGSYVSERKPENIAGPLFISLVLPTKGDFSSEILKGVEEVARENGYFVTFHNSTESPDLEKDMVMDIMSRGSAGFILYPIEPKKNMDVYSRLMISGYPFVLIDRKIQGLEAALVGTDNKKGFYDITTYLIEQGHTRIIFIGSSVFEISSETERYTGFCQALIEHGIPLLHRNLYGTKEDIGNIPDDFMPGTEPDKRAFHYLFDYLGKIDESERPTAIVAVNDQIASLLIYTAVERGISIPGDYSVTGFDNLPFTEFLPVPLTTGAQPATDIGRLAASELFERIGNRAREPMMRTVESEIIVRDSVRKITKI